MTTTQKTPKRQVGTPQRNPRPARQTKPLAHRKPLPEAVQRTLDTKAAQLTAAIKAQALEFRRIEDTKNYAKFTYASQKGTFGSIYIPLASAEGLTALYVFGERE